MKQVIKVIKEIPKSKTKYLNWFNLSVFMNAHWCFLFNAPYRQKYEKYTASICVCQDPCSNARVRHLWSDLFILVVTHEVSLLLCRWRRCQPYTQSHWTAVDEVVPASASKVVKLTSLAVGTRAESAGASNRQKSSCPHFHDPSLPLS